MECFPEPDLWNRSGYTNLSASQHAEDFAILQELIAKEKPLATSIVGPDVAEVPSYFSE